LRHLAIRTLRAARSTGFAQNLIGRRNAAMSTIDHIGHSAKTTTAPRRGASEAAIVVSTCQRTDHRARIPPVRRRASARAARRCSAYPAGTCD
jgi:hypothetical protein